jgi:(6-4)DNA photolyase
VRTFFGCLKQLNSDRKNRNWIYLPYDQLSDQIGPLSRQDPESLGIVLVENRWKARRRPYHKQKLALILSNMRHFALEQARRGVAVEYVVGDAPYSELLQPVLDRLGGARMMEAAERELRQDLAGLGGLTTVPHEGWLTTVEQFRQSQKKLKSWRMDSFYRQVRKETGILMELGKPLGGKFSHDADNRKAWPGDPAAPEPPSFPTDPIKEEVGRLIQEDFSHHPGRLHIHQIPATKEDAQVLWAWAKEQCMPNFGPYEDAMSARSSGLFHTRLSPLLNIHRLLPRQVLEEVLELDIPLSSKEGFVRQILGWREFMRHVHSETDGFRNLEGICEASRPGSAGYPWPYEAAGKEPGGGALPNFFQADTPLPAAFWGHAPSGLHCLDTVVDEVWDEGYSHHITRLMVLSNLATLLGVEPRQLTDWFWVAYCDAYDWVVEPNVLGMGTFALGELFTTKPYISGAAYINRMSDYCQSCRFHPKNNCPITPLFWSFLERNRDRLEGNQRMSMMFRNLAKRTEGQKSEDQRITSVTRASLVRGEILSPEILTAKEPVEESP